MDLFFKSMRFVINIYIITTFITLLVLVMVNLITKITERK
jgi:hypothetical protein